ncbi:DUF7507 domain-containing protein [Microbacterium sp. GCS4]|uniref:DUF7507 domain-containing protein n=1 Tax=Microbacterium sp. GCS4 TaxID=1692239 RepID=UPI000A965E22|nr:DUF11 domain-containing protein [Microbacterium sp. GCS4]
MSAGARSSIRRTLAVIACALLLVCGLVVANDRIAAPSASAAQDPAQCVGAVSLSNGGFETPAIGNATNKLTPDSQVPGWSTTDAQKVIEIWSSGFLGVPAAQGRQFVELNANTPSRLFEDVATTPGQTFYWSLRHRGRIGTDVMRVMIGAPGGTLVQSGANLSDGNTAWGTHTGTYTVPAGQTVTRFAFEAVSSAGGNASAGNFLDDITFGSFPCLVTTKAVTNLSRSGTTAEVGDILRYTVTTRNDGGNPARQAVSTDVLPAGLEFVSGSLSIASGPGKGTVSDAAADDRGEHLAATRTVQVRLGDGATATTGGSVGVGASTSYTFDARVTVEAAGRTLLNEARVVFRDDVTTQSRTSISQQTSTPVNRAADLAIIKTLDTATVVAGRAVSFTLAVSNNGPHAATGVTVTDPILAGMTDVTATSAGATCTVAAAVSCTVPEMGVGEAVQIRVNGTVRADADPGAALTNTATVMGARTDPMLANNTATATATISTVADVSIAKTFAPAAPIAGQDLTYTLALRNAGPAEARDVVLTDPLDPATTFVSAATPQGDCAVQTSILTCAIGTLAPGASVDVTVVVRIPAAATAVVQNTASVTTSTSDAQPANNVDSVSFQPGVVADLSLTKTASAERVSAGDPIDFTLAVRNRGASDAANVVLDDTLPAGFTVAGVEAPAGAACTVTGVAVRCTWATFPVGGPANVTVRARVSADAPAGIVTNTASVAAPADDADTSDNADAVDVEVVHSADLRVEKTAPATGEPGSGFAYTLLVTNAGPSVARGASLRDTLPAGFESAAVGRPGCAVSAGTLVCDLGDLAPGAEATVRVEGRWSATASGVVANTASVLSATPDPRTADNESTAEVRLVPSADVSVVKTTTTPTLPRGGTASFLITVRNDGPSAAAGVTVDEAVPPGLAITAATPSAGSWSAKDARWTVGTLLPGASATLAVTAGTTAEGRHVNTVVASTTTPDPDPSDDRATAAVDVTPSADVSIVKTVAETPAALNRQVSYTLTVANDGPSEAAAVTVADVLPADLLSPATTSPGCTVSGSQLTCTRPTLAAGARFVVAVRSTLDPATAADTLSNTATVASTTADPDPADNSSTVVVPVTGTPQVELVKRADAPTDSTGDGRIGAGDAVAYTFTIRNTGPVTLTAATIEDPLLGGEVGCAAFAAPLPPGSEVTCAPVLYTLSQEDVDRGTLRNDATVLAQSARGSATDEAAAAVTVPAVNAIDLAKSSSTVVDVDGDGRVDAGDTISYTFTVTNAGTTTLRAVRITDPMLGGGVVCPELVGIAIDPGGSVRCPAVSYTLTQDDIDSGVVRNDASVVADAPIGTVRDSAAASADLDRTAAIELSKTAGDVIDVDDDGMIGAGDAVEYTFAVRNTGTTSATGVSVSDPLLGTAPLCDLGVLAPDAVAECGPFRHTLTQAEVEAGIIRNTASVQGTSPLGAVADDAAVDVVVQGESVIRLTKTPGTPVDATGDGRIGAGDTVAYTFTVRNAGTTVLRDIVIEDARLDGVVDCPALEGLTLAPGESATCGAVDLTLTQRDIESGSAFNVASASADSARGVTEDTTSARVEARGTSGVELVKTAGPVVDTNADGRAGAGDTIDYTFLVRNTGTTALRGVVLDDPLLGGAVPCEALEERAVVPGAEVTCGPVPYALSQADADAGTVHNTASVLARSVAGDVGDGAEADSPVPGTDGIALTKSAVSVDDVDGDGAIGAGDAVSYAFVVSHTGTRTLRAAEITDPMLGGAVACAGLDGADLAPGAVVSCAPVVHTLSQEDVDGGRVHNEAVVRATAPGAVIVEDAAEIEVTIDGSTGIELRKSAGAVADVDADGAIGAGDSVAYSFLIRNVGSTTLRDVALDDPLLGGAVACPALVGLALSPGAEVECGPVEHLLVQQDVDAGILRNTATVGARSGADAVEDSATVDVEVTGASRIGLLKSAAATVDANGSGRVDAGDTIAYTFTVTNLGTTGLRDVVVADPRLDGDIRCDAVDLEPGRSTICHGIAAVLTQSEIDAGEIVNTATTTAARTNGETVSAQATVRTPVENQPAIALVKSGGEYADDDGDRKVSPGDSVAFRFSVTNTGARSLTDIVIEDPQLGGRLDCRIPDLAPGETTGCGPVRYRLTGVDVASGEVVNVATVSAAAGAVVVTSGATASVDVSSLAATGGATSIAAVAAVVLLVLGGLMLALARQRRRHGQRVRRRRSPGNV